MRAHLRAWAPVAGWLVFIAVATSVPLPARVWRPTDFPTDLLGHFFLYFGLGWLVARALWTSDRWSVANLVLAVIAAILFAVLDEWHQRWIPRRASSLSDWLADVAGLSFGLALYVWVRWRDWKRTGERRPPVPDETIDLSMRETEEQG